MTLLEGVADNKRMLLSSFGTDFTNKKKTEVWDWIARRVSEVGDTVAGRTSQEVKEKWENKFVKWIDPVSKYSLSPQCPSPLSPQHHQHHVWIRHFQLQNG